MTTVPTIELARARSGDRDRAEVARHIDEANSTIGFLVLTEHDVPLHLLRDLYDVTAEFFDQADEEKAQYAVADRSISRGYVPPRVRSLANTRGGMDNGDLVELFAIGQIDVPDEPYYRPENCGVNFRPNIWPSTPVAMQRIWSEYYRTMERLAAEIMGLFAQALNLPAGYFDDKIDRHISNLFANHYPPILQAPAPGQIRVGEHTDYGSLTLLYQRDDVGGLEVSLDGQWHAVPAMAGAFVVNIGDLMARWTNDRWISTLHRVQNPPPDRWHERRISFPFFCQPNYDTVIEALPSCTGPDRPAKYAPITSGQNMTVKTVQSFAPLTPSGAV